MRKYLQGKIYSMAELLELLISMMLVVVILIAGFKLTFEILQLTVLYSSADIVNDLMGKALTLAVGAEFIKMLCKHSPSTVIEVLMFAIARHMVVGHLTPLETLIGVASIAALFATRKFLFCSFDEIEKNEYRGRMRVDILNKLLNLDIPCEEGETLEQLMKRELEASGEELGLGACVYYHGYALRISQIHNKENITRVEIIRSTNEMHDNGGHHI